MRWRFWSSRSSSVWWVGMLKRVLMRRTDETGGVVHLHGQAQSSMPVAPNAQVWSFSLSAIVGFGDH
jgi:hypothetical protein